MVLAHVIVIVWRLFLLQFGGQAGRFLAGHIAVGLQKKNSKRYVLIK